MGSACSSPAAPPPYDAIAGSVQLQRIAQLRHRLLQYQRTGGGAAREALRFAVARLLQTGVDQLPFTAAAVADVAADALAMLAHSPAATVAWTGSIVTEV